MEDEKLAGAVTKGIGVLRGHTLSRLHDALEMVERGDYAKAMHELHTAQNRLARLTWMEDNVAPFSESMVIKAKDVSEGMELKQWGTVVSRESESAECEAGHQHHHDYITLKFESGFEAQLGPDDEVMLVGQSD